MIPFRDNDPDLPVRAPLVDQPLGLWDSYAVSQRNLLELIPAQALEQPIISGSNAGARWHMVIDPEAVRSILQDRVADYPKSEVARSVLRPAIGESMLVAEGDDWRRQRRMAAPAFQPRHVTGLGTVMTAAAEAASARIAAQDGRAADVSREMVAATFDVIADVTFSGGPGVDRETVMKALEAYGTAAGKMSFLDMIGAPDWVPRPSRLRPAPALQAMKDLADNVLDARRGQSPQDPPDLMDLLLQSEGPDMTAIDLRDNLLAFIVAGHETTALTLAWALYLCGHDPEVQTRARSEAQHVLGPNAATADDLPRLPLIRQIIDEALRLYPPAGFLSRTARERDVLSGHDVLPGDTVTIPVYALHRHRRLWPEADVFDPDRFAKGPPVQRYGYLPFGDGPRICIGARLALQEATIILATLLARFRFKAVPGKVPVPTLIITLRPEGGVWLMVERV